MADESKTPAAPPDFFNLPSDRQQQYLQEPGQLPSDLPQRVGRTALESLPYVGAGALGVASGGAMDVLEVPWWLGLIGRSVGAGLGGGGGEAVKQEAYRGFKMPEAAGTRSEELQRIKDQALEQAGTELVGGVVAKPIELGASRWLNPERAYKSAIHPPGISNQDVTDMLKAGIKHRITPSEEGRQAAEKLAQNFNSQIDRMIATHPVDISPREWTTNLKNRFDKMRADWGSTASGGRANIEQLNDLEKDFLITHGKVRPLMRYDPQKGTWITVRRVEDMDLPELRMRARPISAARMQEVKKSTWRDIRARVNPKGGAVRIPGFATNTNPGLQLEADEEMGRMLREELGNVPAYKGIHQLNAEEGAMYELARAIDRQLVNEGRKKLYPYWLPALMGAGGEMGRWAGSHWGTAGELIGGVAGTTLPLARNLLEGPAAKAQLAFAGELLGRKGVLPSLARSAIRGLPAGAVRGFEYATEQPARSGAGQEPVLEIDPSQFQSGPFGLPARRPVSELPEEASAPPPRAAYEPPVEQVRPQDRPLYERERAMKQPERPLYNWRPEWASELAGAAGPGLPLALLHTVAGMEASGRAAEQQKVAPNLVRSSAGAVGLMQVMPDMHGFTREELEDPHINIEAAAQYLKHLNSKPEYRNRPGLVLAAYNAGEQAVQDAGYKVYNMTKKTQTYVGNGLRMWAQLALSPDQAAAFITEIPETLK